MAKGGRIFADSRFGTSIICHSAWPRCAFDKRTPSKTLFPMALWETSHYVSNRLLMSLYRRAMVETVSPALFEERRRKKKQKTFSKLFTKPLVLRFATVASIARISSGRGGKKHLQRGRAASWQSWEQLKSSFDCKEGVLSQPPPPLFPSSARPVPEVLVLRPLWVINHSDLFSCQYQQKDPKPNKDVFNKRVFFPPFRRGANIVQRGLLLTVLTSSNLIQYS